jgi:hypothetical protein
MLHGSEERGNSVRLEELHDEEHDWLCSSPYLDRIKSKGM